MLIKMDAFDAYKHYLALKNHFTSKTYDYFRYNGAIKANRQSFEQRRDKYFFQKLAKRKDITDFLVSIFAYGKQDAWIGDMLRNEQTEALYTKWQRVKQSLTYVFTTDIDKLNDDLISSFEVVDGQHPHALKLLLSEEIHIETFIILNDLLRFTPSWNKRILDPVVWPSVRQRCKKYHPFVEYDREKMKKIIEDRFSLQLGV